MPLCFEITINGGSPVVAGVDGISVLSACLTFVSSGHDLELRVGGLISHGRHDNEHLEWIATALRTGDGVLIRVIDGAIPDDPVSRKRDDPAASERAERAYYEQLKARYEPTRPTS